MKVVKKLEKQVRLKKKIDNMHFYVINYDGNKKKFYNMDIIPYLRDYILRKNGKDLDKEEIISQFKYYFMSRCEFEICIKPLFVRDGEDRAEKISAWYQLEPNIDVIFDYILNNLDDKK